MELRRYLAILWRRKLLIALAIVAAVGFTAATTDRTAVYSSRATIYVGANSFIGDGPNDNLSGDETVGLGQVIRTFATMIVSSSIAEDAIALTGAPRSPLGVVAATTASQVPGTNILQVEVRDTDPAIAQSLATGMAQAFVAKISELEPGQPLGEGDVPKAPAQIFERAQLSTSPKSTSLLSNLFVAAMLALLGSSGLVLLAEYLDITVKSAEDAEARLELPMLGAVPVMTLDPATTTRALRPPVRDNLGLVRDA